MSLEENDDIWWIVGGIGLTLLLATWFWLVMR